MQQHLPFTVLKRIKFYPYNQYVPFVATALTVYGIETGGAPGKAGGSLGGLQQHLPFTVLKPKKVETYADAYDACCNSTYRLRY